MVGQRFMVPFRMRILQNKETYTISILIKKSYINFRIQTINMIQYKKGAKGISHIELI